MPPEAETAPAAAPEAAPAPAPAAPEQLTPQNDPDLASPTERLNRAKKAAKAEEAAARKAAKEKAPEPEAAAPVAEPDEIAKAKADRAARFEALRKREAERQAASQQKRAKAPPDNPDEVRMPRAKALELAEIEKALGDEEAFLSLAEKRGVTAEKLAQHIRERLTNPERIAIMQARKVAAESESKWETTARGLFQEIQSVRQELARAQEARDLAEARQVVVAHVQSNARIAPLSAAYLASKGEEKYLQLASTLANSLPEGAGVQALHDLVEQHLEEFQLSQPARPAPAKPNPTAAAKASHPSTVTNSLASQSTAVADEDGFALLPLEQRLKILKSRQE